MTRYGRARSSRHRALPQRRHSCVSSSASTLRVRRARARMHAASSQPALPKTSASTCCDRRRPCAFRRRRPLRSFTDSRLTRWSPRSTGRRHGAGRAGADRSRNSVADRARDARQVAARRARRLDVPTGQDRSRRSANEGARGRDVRFRAERTFIGRVSGSSRCAGLGRDRVRRVRSAWSADQNAVKRQSEDPVLRCDQRARGTETIHKSDAHGSWHWVMLCIIDRGHGLTGVGG